jgi:hypothetical protein
MISLSKVNTEAATIGAENKVENNFFTIIFNKTSGESIRSVSGFIVEDFKISTSVSSSPINELDVITKLRHFSTGANVLAGALEQSFGGTVSSIIRNVQGYIPPAGTNFGGTIFSTEIWDRTEKPSFTIPVVLVSTNKDVNVNETIRFLTSACQPRLGSAANVQLIYPPKYFMRGVDLRVGKWFYASDLLITSTEFTISKQVTTTGQPLFAKGSISLKPRTLVTAKDVEGWFQGLKERGSLGDYLSNVTGEDDVFIDQLSKAKINKYNSSVNVISERQQGKN